MNTKKLGLLLALLSFLTISIPPLPGLSQVETPTEAEQPTSSVADQTIYLPLVCLPGTNPSYGDGSWPMVAANPERTSWTPEEVSGNLNLEWYRPIEAYIPQNVQIIAEYGMLFISTARGLYALNAANGETVWRFDTELPLGNSPTVKNGVVYVSGYDRKLHAINAYNGNHLWAFTDAQAGFDTNPLVVDGIVIAGNRDGTLYAIGAQGTPYQGQLLWKFKTGGPIHLSAAYRDGIVYFAANDNYAYALDVETGAVVWKSEKLPGDGYHSYWPVIYRDKVIFSAASGYRAHLNPGTQSVQVGGDETGYEKTYDMDRDSIWPYEPEGALLGSEVPGQEWAHGYPVIDASRITEYHEANPNPDPYKHKPWRRVHIVLNLSDGREFTFDSDHDGYAEYIPLTMWGTHSGNHYPPVVGPDGILYQMNIYQKLSIPQGRVMGWNPDTPSYLSVLFAPGAVDEPQSISAGGNLIYRSISSDRVGDWFDITNPTRSRSWDFAWHYSFPLFEQAPGYDDMMWIWDPDSPARMYGSYGNINGLYFQGGDQPPIVPYQGRLYIHRSNAVIAYGPGPAIGKLPLLRINHTQDNIETLTLLELQRSLEVEIQKIIDAGHLRPGYLNNGQFFPEFANYFENPGDTLYTLALAYPHLSPQLQVQANSYLRQEFQDYFDPNMYATIGWAEGAARENMPLPPEVEESLAEFVPRLRALRFTWEYPPHNFYALWKYAEIVPEDTERAYELAKSRLQVPVPEFATNNHLLEKTWEHNAYITGYIGFLKLQELAGMVTQDSLLRQQVTNELDRLLQLRVNTFTKDTPWIDRRNIHKRHFNISRNFMMLVPELGDYLNQHLLTEVQEAIDEYNYVAPYWFVSRYETVHNEGVISHLYNYQAMFQAKAYILKEPQEELVKYLDVPAFTRGDLFYIQNLIAALEAP